MTQRRGTRAHGWPLLLAFAPAVAAGAAAWASEGPALPPTPECVASTPAGPGLSEAEIQMLLADPDADLDHVYHFEHDVPMDAWRTIRIQEHFTLRAAMADVRRGILFLNGPAFHGNNYSIPVEGYDATGIFAGEGWFAYTADYLGVGCSTHPKNGDTANFENDTAAMEAVVAYVRALRDVPRVDLYGEGIGGAIATQLAADPTSIRTVVMVGMLYKTLPEGGPTTDPDFLRSLHQDPDGYFEVPVFLYFLFFSLAPPDALGFVLATQPGLYPTGPFYVGGEPPPYFDPGVAQVPGLVVFGPFDILATPNDPWDLVADYGTSGAELAIIDGAGHVPRIETPTSAAAHWAAVLAFLNAH